MAEKMVNFRMNGELKEELEQICKSMGMSMSTAFTLFAVKVTREKRIPFEITADPFYSETNINFLKEAKKELDSGNYVKHDLIEV